MTAELPAPLPALAAIREAKRLHEVAFRHHTRAREHLVDIILGMTPDELETDFARRLRRHVHEIESNMQAYLAATQ